MPTVSDWYSHSHVFLDAFGCVTWLISMCDMTHSYVGHDSFVRGLTGILMHVCVVTHLCVSVTRSHVCVVAYSYVWHESCSMCDKCVAVCCSVLWLIRMCDMSHVLCVTAVCCSVLQCVVAYSYVWHESCSMCDSSVLQCVAVCCGLFVCVTWIMFYGWHDLFIRGTWLMYMWDMTHAYVYSV